MSDIPADFETARAESERLTELIDRARAAYYGDGDTPLSDAEYQRLKKLLKQVRDQGGKS